MRSASLLALRPVIRAHKGRLAERLSEVRPMDAPEFAFAPSDSRVIETVFWAGLQGYEGVVTEVWRGMCRDASSVLEIGANVGLLTVVGAAAMAPGGRFAAVEPVPAVAAALRENLRRNDLEGCVEVLVAAAVPGVEEREVTLSVPAEGGGLPVGAHLVEGVEVSGRARLEAITVPGLPMARLAAGRGAIKIDAEGIEAELLAAAREELRAGRPALLLEVLPEAENLAALIREMAQALGYTISVLPEWCRLPIAEIAPGEFSAAVPKRHNSKSVALTVGPAPVW